MQRPTSAPIDPAVIAIHFAISRRQEPWLIALGGASVAGAIVVVGIAGLTTDLVRAGHWVTLLLLAGLLTFLWFRAVSTKHGFVTAKSIYLASKETLDAQPAPQKPWLGLPQWVAFCGASTALRVAPGDPDGSLLVWKLAGKDAEGHRVCGDRMPLGWSALSDAELDRVRAWIEAGAHEH